MRDYMFRSRWGALIFVGLTAAGAASLVGTGKGDGTIDNAKRQLIEQRAAAQGFTVGGPGGLSETPVEFTPDEELIDPAVGDDPTPPDQRRKPEKKTGAEEAPSDTVVLISDGPTQQGGAQ